MSQDETVICLHSEVINSSNNIGTCRLCGQQRRYDPANPKEVRLIKRGRIKGILTMVVPPLLPKPGEAEARPESRRHMPLGRPRTGEWRKCKGCGADIYVRRYRIEKGRGEYCKKCYGKNNPPPKRIKKEVIVMDNEERKPIPKKPQGRKTRTAYWNKNKEAILVDYGSMLLRAFLERWHMATTTWIQLKKLWSIPNKIKGAGGKPGVKATKKAVKEVTSEDVALTEDIILEIVQDCIKAHKFEDDITIAKRVIRLVRILDGYNQKSPK